MKFTISKVVLIYVIISTLVSNSRENNEERLEWIEQRRFCGSKLNDAIKFVCRSFIPATTSNSQPRKIRRGIVEECCDRPCQLIHLRQYCSDNEDAFGEWAPFVIFRYGNDDKLNGSKTSSTVSVTTEKVSTTTTMKSTTIKPTTLTTKPTTSTTIWSFIKNPNQNFEYYYKDYWVSRGLP